MEILREISELSRIPDPIVLSIGVFDGVHLGHRRVLQSAIDQARNINGRAVAMTFDPHPARILRPDRAPRLLTSTPHKARLIKAVGIRTLLLVKFDREFAAKRAEEFVRELANAGSVRRICVGEGWACGRGRSGNVPLLRQLGAELGFEVSETPPVTIDGKVVSSTRIREAVETGDLRKARKLLGRDYTVLGTVERGDEIGRSIGFPTANLRAHNEQFPPDGVYAVRVNLDGREFGGVANIGVRPTIDSTDGERRLEVHIFDFNGDLYGRDLDVDFLSFLRKERKFDSLEELRAQIATDASAARSQLNQAA